MTGMPPPPTPTTMKSLAISVLMASSSTILSGMGEAIIRRQPRPASSFTIQPSASNFSAFSFVVKPPMPLVGFLKPGSLRSTSTWVTTAATDRLMPRVVNSLSSAREIM